MAIIGRVVDATGKPVPDTFVTALSPEPQDRRGFRMVSALLRSLTNERGEFRLDTSLYFGEFYVVALPHNVPFTADRQPNRSGYANTFYPSAIRLSDAKRVRVAPTGPARIDITLAPARLSAIAGTVFGSRGQPVPGGRLGLVHGDGLFGLDARALPINADGTFLAPGLQPGTYHLRFHESQLTRRETLILSGATVTLDNADITNVRVLPIRSVSVTGRLIVESGARGAPLPAAIRIGASPIDFDGNPGPLQPGTVNDDLTFQFTTWPSLGKVRVTLPSNEWSVKAITLNGRDVNDKPIEFVAGKQVTGLEIELARNAIRH